MHINNKRLWADKCTLLLMVLFMLLPIAQSRASYNIGPDDVLRITVYGYEDLKTETRVSADGQISFPLIGDIEAGGKSSMALEKAIARRLAEGGFIQDAQVNITVLERVSQQVSVLGYVNKPGRYSLDSDSAIVDVIAMAGGINELGSNTVVVTRTVNGKQQKRELDLRFFLEDVASSTPFIMQQGDLVYVPKASLFYIYGEVQHPGEYRIEPDISVVKALSVGGGLTLRGTENGIVIRRKDKQGVLQEIDAELSDAVLKDDVIYVGERWF
ncbi:MAG: polysaccharide export protein EpsE [Methylovulum sp.]|nr:polysaccharide export protein EpsE [Methylovulum sp.]